MQRNSMVMGILFGILLSPISFAWAEKADQDKPLNAQSDSLRYDDANQTSVFLGNVVVTKGTIVLRGGRIDIKQDKQGNQFATVTAETNKLAYFKQKRDALTSVEENIEATADVIVYDGKIDTITLKGNALLKRLKGGSISDEVSGNVVLYNNKTDVYTVDSVPNKTNTANNGRVKVILTPNTTANVTTNVAKIIKP